MDKLQWFKFTPIDWVMGKVQRCPEITQARYIRLICLYWNKEGILPYEDAEIEIDKEHLDILISKKVVKVDNDFIVIDFLKEQINEIKVDKNDKSYSGKIGNLKRWHPELYDKYINKELTLDEAVTESTLSHPNRTPIIPQSQPNRKTSQTREEKRREDKTREEKIRQDNSIFKPPLIDEVIEYFISNGYRKDVAEKAFNYYDVADWKDSNGKKVKSWKQKMQIVWFKDENKEIKKKEVDDGFFINQNGFKIMKGVI